MNITSIKKKLQNVGGTMATLGPHGPSAPERCKCFENPKYIFCQNCGCSSRDFLILPRIQTYA